MGRVFFAQLVPQNHLNTFYGFTEDELVEMLECVDLKEDLITVERREIIDELCSQIIGNPDIVSHFGFSKRSLRELGL